MARRDAASILAALDSGGLPSASFGSSARATSIAAGGSRGLHEGSRAAEGADGKSDEFLAALRSAAMRDLRRGTSVDDPERPRWAFRGGAPGDLSGPSDAPGRAAGAGGAAGAGADAGSGRGFVPPSRASRAPRSKKPAFKLNDLTAADKAFFATLGSHRNFYFIARMSKLEHHLSVRYTVDGADVHVHYSGSDAASLRREATIVRGPCCRWGAPQDWRGADRDPEEEKELVSTVRKDVKSAVRGVEGLEVEYRGQYQELSVTEFIVRTKVGRSVRDDLVAELVSAKESLPARSFSTPKDDMDRLDLEMMLSCLNTSSSSAVPAKPATGRSGGLLGPLPPIGGGGGTSGFASFEGATAPDLEPLTDAEESGMRALSAATMTLYLDSSGTVLNEDYWKRENIMFATSSLGELRPREGSYWLKTTATEPGSMQFRSNSRVEVEPVADAAIEAMRAIEASTYRSGLSAAQFLYGSNDLPVGYREVRGLMLRCTPLAPDGKEGDEAAAPGGMLESKWDPDAAQEDAEAHAVEVVVPLSMHAAYHAPPTRVRRDVKSMGLSLCLEVYLRGKLEARLTVVDAAGKSTCCRRAVAGRARATSDGAVTLDAVGFLTDSFEVQVAAVIDGVARRVAVSSGACEVW